MGGLLPHVLKVASGRADIRGGHVAATQRVDKPAVGPHQSLGLVPVGVADDDSLSAAEMEAGGGRLVGHPPGEAQGVSHCLCLAFVRPHPSTTAGRPQSGVVDSNYGLEARAGVGEHRHLFVAFVVHTL